MNQISIKLEPLTKIYPTACLLEDNIVLKIFNTYADMVQEAFK